MAFASTAFVLLRNVASEMLLPGSNDLIEMLEDDLPHLASQPRCALVLKNLRQYRKGLDATNTCIPHLP
jgi:hypothetical protein